MRRRELILGAAALALATDAFGQAAGEDPAALSQDQFLDWVGEMRARALADGITTATWDAALQGLAPDPVGIARRAAAAETNQTLTEYVLRLLNGRGKRARAK